ncbi:hypothetical protein BKA67DRAFT_45456 [Truncatella angustata]|uniref:HTH La-type RNA-binding domain-containing protein n=1 Tax=Truncatella angustata TaxID=152316 RepID=A0A9P8UY19_9PEZI|nr:uncharacterized protein BKA67DRAFT_45456 [Truncatella angustata]KAH6660240.1 hypothetical protein BKA67DRAFT_45456 [Truncatella angustata]KAH8194679.1 hypothetical protein TruAng_011159 [Truncatella angustata]
MSTFSYAAAARGQLSTTPSAPQSVTSQAASTTSFQNADAITPATGTSAVSDSSPSTDLKEQDSTDNSAPPVAQADSVSKTESEDAEQAVQEDDAVQKSTAAETSAAATPDRKSAHEGPTERRGAKGPSARASDASDNRKSRKGKKSKANDKDAEQEPSAEKEKEPEPPKVQLTDAPIPSVNIWAQRAKDVQKAPQPASSRTSAAAPGSQQDAKAKSAVNENDNASRASATSVKGQKKDFARDVGEPGPRKHAPRGSRVVEKTATESLPSVADAASWPTPETAATEIKTHETPVKPAENEDAQEERAGSGPKDKPKWVAVPFVPSAVFETPLPSRNPRGSKTGAPRGGREAGPRGHAVDRAQAAGPARPAGERSTEATNGARPSPTTAPTKRGSVDNAVSRDVRKVPGSSKEATDASSTAQVNGVEETVKASQSENKEASTGQQQVVSDISGAEKRTETRPDPSREAFTPAAKDNSHHHASKPEKRGGRGRGGHPGANGQGHRGHGAYSLNGQSFQSRQNSYPGNVPMNYGMPAANGANGHSSRNSTSNAYFRGNGRNGRGQNAQTPPTWNMDPSLQSMPPMAHQPYFYEQNILSLLQKQLAYYFSINNLLKDSFLRRCMDSQGYVFLDVILSFQRIQQLTSDVNMVRMACMECVEIELVTGQEDHRDRMRRVQGWEEFVYPKGSRNDEVNFDDGPANVWKHDRNIFMQQYPMVSPFQMESPGFYPPPGAPFAAYGNDGYPHYNMTNGVNGHSTQKDTQLSATVPEFSPQGGSSASDQDQTAALKHMANVNGTAPTLTNGVNDAAAQPYTNGVAGDGEVAAH